MRGTAYQIWLIILGVVITAMFSAFLYKELFPEYKTYQKDYIALEEFRSTYSGSPSPPFQKGVKQIVMEKQDKGPADIDRCTSCHVAVQIPHFSKTKVATDINGNMIIDDEGFPVQVPNENYIFTKLDEKIAELEKTSPKEAAHLKELKKSQKVLAAHPLLGRETRPFEYHPIDDYGCTVCHNGNGRALTTDKAHGPVFDEEYEPAFLGPKREFLEKDPENDPPFAHIFNDKPEDYLLFQTTPIYVEGLIEAKCIQCHVGSKTDVEKTRNAIQTGFEHDQKALQTLLSVGKKIEEKGVDQTVVELTRALDDPSLTEDERKSINSQIVFLQKVGKGAKKIIDTQVLDLKNSQKEKILSSAGANVLAKVTSEIDRMTTHFKRGESLFLSQGCYACHRIEGRSRGGVGPDLTNEGKSYPWFVKESISWPQADLKTSTMPNFRLDHAELEDLVTYLLGQMGRPESVSEVDWKTRIAKWDGGEKLPWEKEINPVNLRDVRYGMTVFAEQGCAACHRLKGFESNLAYVDPKDKEWFRSTFPEEISGKELVKAIQENQKGIEKKLKKDPSKNGILEEIEARNPGLLESFYTNFKFAGRALKQNQEILSDVLMMYIQEYGLGRLIGPRPNWSGIYRTDEWLIGHFRKPSHHTPYSIMPVFPFDDSKFYALTYMLDVLALKNAVELRKDWEQNGFDPALAYQTLCSQCHGEYLHGNGPVAEWIYPIPKNLRNADFLRNYTKENVIFSLTHGIKGTPMPPWGEVASDKPFENSHPVLNKNQIHQLVDWIFSSLSGGSLIKSAEDVPKWQYEPDDAIREMKQEGNELKSGKPPENLHLYELEPGYQSMLSCPDLPYLAALEPIPTSLIHQYFDRIPNPEPDAKKDFYYIKKKYYTEENIQKGKDFFELNCSVCHGRDADGMGYRAGTMYDAKPRMLTNLPWLDMRDDLRLLRSIKYGVAGTSMTQWGDQTSSLQRMQLVIYIRSLSLEQKEREAVIQTIYNVYEKQDQILDLARSYEFKTIDQMQKELESLKEKRENNGLASNEEIVALFKDELEVKKRLNEHQKQDSLLLEIKNALDKEREVSNIVGVQLIGVNLGEQTISLYQKLLEATGNRFSFDGKNLNLNLKTTGEEKAQEMEKVLLDRISKNIDDLKRDKSILEGKISSVERNQALEKTNQSLNTLSKLKNDVASGIKQAKLLREKQKELFLEYTKQGTNNS
jgi:mono/diheme cytochrome c family protein